MKIKEFIKTKFFKVLVITIIGSSIFGGLIGTALARDYVPKENNNKTTTTKVKDNNKKTTTKTTKKENSNVKIKKAETETITYETYKDDYISIKIPKGWKVEVDEAIVQYLTLHITNPNHPDYQLFMNFKMDGFTKSQAAKNWYSSMGSSSQSLLPVLVNSNTDTYFKAFTELNSMFKQYNNGKSYFPALNNFTKTQSLGTSNLGGEIIRGSFTGGKGNAEGVFTVFIKDISVVQANIDVGYYIAYYTAFYSTPEGELINWQSILNSCLESLEFTEKFQNEFYSNLEAESRTLASNRRQYQAISQGIMDSWNKRQTSLDIQSQKRSDATLGYERVYDTDTGEVYKAYNGFSDNYSGTKYKPISDNQYTEKIVGYIEK